MKLLTLSLVHSIFGCNTANSTRTHTLTCIRIDAKYRDQIKSHMHYTQYTHSHHRAIRYERNGRKQTMKRMETNSLTESHSADNNGTELWIKNYYQWCLCNRVMVPFGRMHFVFAVVVCVFFFHLLCCDPHRFAVVLPHIRLTRSLYCAAIIIFLLFFSLTR